MSELGFGWANWINKIMNVSNSHDLQVVVDSPTFISGHENINRLLVAVSKALNKELKAQERFISFLPLEEKK